MFFKIYMKYSAMGLYETVFFDIIKLYINPKYNAEAAPAAEKLKGKPYV